MVSNRQVGAHTPSDGTADIAGLVGGQRYHQSRTTPNVFRAMLQVVTHAVDLWQLAVTKTITSRILLLNNQVRRGSAP